MTFLGRLAGLPAAVSGMYGRLQCNAPGAMHLCWIIGPLLYREEISLNLTQGSDYQEHQQNLQKKFSSRLVLP